MKQLKLPSIDGSVVIEVVYYEGRSFVILNSAKLENVGFRLEDLQKILDLVESPKDEDIPLPEPEELEEE